MAKDTKRKATDEPTSPTAAKRVKVDESVEPEKQPLKVPAIPFPEKVFSLFAFCVPTCPGAVYMP